MRSVGAPLASFTQGCPLQRQYGGLDRPLESVPHAHVA